MNKLYFRLINPCDECAAPYGYKNVMRLSQDTSMFSVRLDFI